MFQQEGTYVVLHVEICTSNYTVLYFNLRVNEPKILLEEIT